MLERLSEMKSSSRFYVVAFIATMVVSSCFVRTSAATTHSVTFRKLNGTVLQSFEVEHGANASSLAPTVPSEADMTPHGWDHADWLECVTNDVTCWALYEASTAKSPSTSIASASVANRETPYSLEEYFKIYDNLAWSDEFPGSALSVGNDKNWQNDTEQGSADLAVYTRGNNHTVSDGTLKLNCRRESATRITSARINSKNRVAFKKGRCEIRAKLTKQEGAFPAFWTMGSNRGWPWGGEIDIFEQLNGSEWITCSLHMPRYPNSNYDQSYESGGESLAIPEDGVHWGDGFHRIGIIVNERELVWYVDDYICQRMDIRDAKYDILRDYSQFIILNFNFGGTWSGHTSHNDSAISSFQSEDFEIDYCRIFTNTNENNTIVREFEPNDARLSGPVKATVWRGWQMRWGKSGANYYQNHLVGGENYHIRAATREYFGRDNADIVTFLTRTTANSGGKADSSGNNLESPIDVPGYTAVYLSPNSGRGSTNWDGDIREKLLSTVLFNRERFSKSDSAVGTLQISNDYNFTNGCAVVAELVERDTGAKVKVVSVFVSSINEATTAGSVAKQGFDALISKLDAMKDEKVILLIQGWNNGCLEYLNNRVSSELGASYSSLGQYTKPSYVYQSAWATANYVSASAENPAPLSVPKANGQASGVHTNQSFCATVRFDADPPIEYGQLDQSAFAKKMDVKFSGYSGTTLTDFPVLVKLSTAINGFSYDDFQMEHGGDLRFADSTGKLLPHEIDTWNPSGVSTVWVKLPSLSANAKITACYGCDGPPAVAAKDVWDDDYVGVWHLGESALPMKESSETSTDFSQSNGTGIGFASQGIVGGSVDFGESGKYRALIAPDHNALDGFSQCTFEAWTYVDSAYRATGSDVNKGLLSKRVGYNSQISYYLHDTGSATKFFISSSGTSSTEMSASVKPDTDTWTHQAYTFDGTTSSNNVKGWKNGANVGTSSKSVTSVFAGSANLYLGNFGFSGNAVDARNFPGRIDEVRISKVARSAAWIKATHDTVANASFATYAVEGAAQEPASRTLPFKRGTNCRGLDEKAYSSSTWNGSTYIYGLDSTYTDIKAKGFDFVRFSVDLTKYYDGTGDQLYTSGSYDIGIIDTFIQKFLDAGLSVHLLMGRFEGGDIDVSNADHKEKFKKVWQRIAEHYKDSSDKVAFELCNEPHGDVTTLNNLFRDTVALIRQTNPTRMILWPTGDGSQPWMLTQAATPPKFSWVTLPEGDTNIAVVVHTYAPADFTHQGASWTTDGNGNKRNYHTDLTDAYRTKLREDLKYISQYAQAHPNVPIVLNEFGVMSGLSYASDAHEWLSTVREFCEAHSNIAWAHFEYTDFNNAKQMATRSHPTGDTWRTNVVDALFPKGWDDQPLTYEQLDMDSFSKKLQVSFTGYAGTETLTDFPVLVKLSSAISGFSYDDFQMANGGDLRFADSTGRQIPHEIDTWNPDGESTVWVRVPSLTATTRIYACYGCANPPAVTAMDVWNDDYVGVWHLNEGGLPLYEASHRGPSFTLRSGPSLSFAAEGVVGGSVDFGGGMSNAVIAVDHENLDGFEKFTIEAWTKQSAHKSSAGILSKRFGYNNQTSYYLYDAGSATRFCVSDAGTNLPVQANVATPNVNGSWQHQACSIDTTLSTDNVKGYLNGGYPSTASQASGSAYDGIACLTLGNLQPGAKDNAFNGSIDEVRISKCVRSADWIKASHDTVANANFATYSFGDAPPPEPESILYVNVDAGVTDTLNAALVTEYITNIVKQGAGTLVASALSGYTGDFSIEGGVFEVGVQDGAGTSGASNTIYVLDGASLRFTGTVANILSGRKLVFEGAPAQGQQGKFLSAGGAVRIGTGTSLELRDDATMAVTGTQRMMLHTADIDLGGNALTIVGSGKQASFDGSTFRNPGRVVIGQSTTFMQEGGTMTFASPASGTGSLTLLKSATLNLKASVSAEGWTLYATNGSATVTSNTARFPQNSNTYGWNGRIVFEGSEKLATYGGGYNVSNTVFNVRGGVSGSGTLNVGPGWLNLHSADNTYSGAVTVNGQNLTSSNPILAGGGGIGLWNGAACFPNAASITFTNTARLAFMDNTACTVPNVTFVALAGETQSISGGVYTVRSSIAGIVKEGAGTLIVDSPAQITGLADVQEGMLKIAYAAPVDGAQEGILVPQPQFSGLKFASGTTFDLSANYGFKVADLTGSPSVANAGVFGVSGKWTLSSPDDRLSVAGENVVLGDDDVSGTLAFASGATFDLSDEAAFSNAVVAAGAEGLVVARARRMLGELSLLGMTLALPHPTASISENWEMRIGSDNQTLRLFLNSSASGYAAWIAEKDLTGDDAAFEKETNGIKNGIRYAFDIDPASSTVGDPIIKVVPDSNGNPVVEARNLADGRDDVAFGVLATENLNDWTGATLVPMKKFSDGLWKPTASESHTYVFPAQMFFKYTIDIE